MIKAILYSLLLTLFLVGCDTPKTRMIKACESEVKLQLKAPATAVFSSNPNELPGELRATMVEGAFKWDDKGIGYSAFGKTYIWVAYVDAQNSFGAQIKTPFTCVYEEETEKVSVSLH